MSSDHETFSLVLLPWLQRNPKTECACVPDRAWGRKAARDSLSCHIVTGMETHLLVLSHWGTSVCCRHHPLVFGGRLAQLQVVKSMSMFRNRLPAGYSSVTRTTGVTVTATMIVKVPKGSAS